MPIPAEVRAELVRRARDKRRRTAEFSAHSPCEWRPWEVLHPDSGLPFTDAGAWNFVAELLESGHDASTVTLRKPPGKEAYEILAAGHRSGPNIYIKLTLSGPFVHGRSFHNSEF
jgi:hypothetical protein